MMKRALTPLIALLVLAACAPAPPPEPPTLAALPSATDTAPAVAAPTDTLAPPTVEATAAALVPTETALPPSATPAPTDTPPAPGITPSETPAPTLTLTPPPTLTPSLTITMTITPTPSHTLTPTLDAGGFSALIDMAARITVQPPEVRYGPGTATALWAIGDQIAGTARAAQPTATDPASQPGVVVIGTVSGDAPAACAALPGGAVGAFLTSDPAFAAQLGCALGAPLETAGAAQSFERGLMIYRAAAVPGAPGTIEALSSDGRFSRYVDTWISGIDPDSGNLAPPPGLVEPIRGFGKVWRSDGALMARLGWALAGEQGVALTVQAFERGAAIYVPSQNTTYLLADDAVGAPAGSWRQVSGGF
jgi:hypothetical protein